MAALFKRSREKGVTFNRAKCEFRRIVYYGLMFSKDGVSPNPCKVKTIKSAGRPRNVAELNSFLCTVRYSSRFMEARQYQKTVGKLGELVTGKCDTQHVKSCPFNRRAEVLNM